MVKIFDATYRLFMCIWGQARSGFRGNPIKGASLADTASRLGVTRMPMARAALAHMRSDAATASIMDEKWLAPSTDLDALLALPEDTLGYTYARLITDKGYDPAFYDEISTEDDAGYVGMRMRQTHDLWHVITGIETDFFGELALQACMVAQLHLGLAVFQLVAGLVRTVLKSPEELPRVMACIVHGYTIGRQAGPLLAQKFELGWERPLRDWQRELGIVPTAPWLQRELSAPIGGMELVGG